MSEFSARPSLFAVVKAVSARPSPCKRVVIRWDGNLLRRVGSEVVRIMGDFREKGSLLQSP